MKIDNIYVNSMKESFHLFRFSKSALSGKTNRPDLAVILAKKLEIKNPKDVNTNLDTYTTPVMLEWKQLTAGFGSWLTNSPDHLEWGPPKQEGRKRNEKWAAIHNSKFDEVLNKYDALELAANRIAGHGYAVSPLWESIVEKREWARAGGTGLAFDEADFPDEATVRASFVIDLHNREMPTAVEDVRCGLNEDQSKRLAAGIAKRERGNVSAMIEGVFTDLLTELDRVEKGAAKGKGFHGELTAKVLEVASSKLPLINLFDDERVAKLQASISEKFSKITSEEVRDEKLSTKARNSIVKDARTVKEEAAAIIDGLGGFGS